MALQLQAFFQYAVLRRNAPFVVVTAFFEKG
jgi:hypothetical protein